MSEPAEHGDDPGTAHEQWSARHGGLDPHGSAWVSGWVRLTHACARPLARRRVSPDAVTAAAVLLSSLVALLAWAGAAWPLLATVVVVVAAVLDGVDGALASQTGTTSRWGAVLDPLADRVSDLLLVLALVLLGAPAWLGALLGALTLLLESVRASAQVVGVPGAVAVTVWERPSRVIVTAFSTTGCAVAWLAAGSEDVAAVAIVGAVVGTALAGAGLVTLLRAVRRELG